jgi:hypothetical protein
LSDQSPPAPTFDMPPLSAGFDARGAWVLAHLQIDLDLTPVQASGLVGNLGGESGLVAVQEVSPLAGRGGFGWAQWTGPRRVAFETWCSDNGLDQRSDEANYRFLVAELKDQIPDDPQSHTVTQLKKTTTLEAAVYTVEAIFERPADLQSGLPARIHFAQRALAAAMQLPQPAGPTVPVPSSGVLDPDSQAYADWLNAVELARVNGQPAPPQSDFLPKADPVPPQTAQPPEPPTTVPTPPAVPPMAGAPDPALPPAPPPPPPTVIGPVVPYGSADLSRMPVWVLPLIGLFILCIFVFALVSSVFYIKDTTLQTTMMTGALGMALTTVGYYFGSSSGSKAKDDTIAVKMNS